MCFWNLECGFDDLWTWGMDQHDGSSMMSFTYLTLHCSSWLHHLIKPVPPQKTDDSAHQWRCSSWTSRAKKTCCDGLEIVPTPDSHPRPSTVTILVVHGGGKKEGKFYPKETQTFPPHLQKIHNVNAFLSTAFPQGCFQKMFVCHWNQSIHQCTLICAWMEIGSHLFEMQQFWNL